MECANVGLNTLFKAATMKGMSNHIFTVYSYGIAALLLLPAPFFSFRSRVLPPLSTSIICKIGLLGLIGSTSQIMGYTGIKFSSPALATAISNLTPAFTFILAIIFRALNISFIFASGFVGAAINVVHTWSLHLKGPAYIANFKPLSIVIAGAMNALFLADALYLGSVIGAVIISIGFYAVIWGKAKEEGM